MSKCPSISAGRFDPDLDELTFKKAPQTPAVTAAMETAPFREFPEFVQYPIWVTEPAPDREHATRVSLVDLRFGTPYAPGFAATATVTDRNQVEDRIPQLRSAALARLRRRR